MDAMEYRHCLVRAWPKIRHATAGKKALCSRVRLLVTMGVAHELPSPAYGVLRLADNILWEVYDDYKYEFVEMR
jgi:hypothetical protein